MSWSNRLSFVVASIGAAVGLGSLWFLPYQVYAFGGAVFFLSFMFFTLTAASLALYAEVLLGRTIQSSLWKGLPALSASFGKIIAILFYTTLGLIISFYSVVSSQAFYCALSQSLSVFHLLSSPLQEISLIASLENSLALSLAVLLIFWKLLYFVLSRPIAHGLEKASKVLIALLVIALLVMITHSYLKGILTPALIYLFAPHWNDFSYQALMNSFSTALFGLAVGAGCMISYGSYLHQQQKDKTLIQDVLSISFSCLLISFLSCLSLFPYVFDANMAFTSGPNLVFEVLPVVFKSLGYFGEILASMYLVALFTAGFTSCFSLIEPFILLLCEHFYFQRSQAAAITCLIGVIPSCAIVVEAHLGLGLLMPLVINSVTNYLLPLGVIAVFYLLYCQAQQKLKIKL